MNDQSSSASKLEPLETWKKAMLAGAMVFIVIGGLLSFLGGSSTAAPAPDAGVASAQEGDTELKTTIGEDGASAQGQGLVPGGPGMDQEPGGGESPSGSEGSSALGDWSPFFLKGGFSFFVAFCVGYALRSFFKISILALGAIFMVLFALSYIDFITVEWSALEGVYDKAFARIKEEAQGFKTFITGSLPSAGLAGLGLFAGFKRR